MVAETNFDRICGHGDRGAGHLLLDAVCMRASGGLGGEAAASEAISPVRPPGGANYLPPLRRIRASVAFGGYGAVPPTATSPPLPIQR